MTDPWWKTMRIESHEQKRERELAEIRRKLAELQVRVTEMLKDAEAIKAEPRVAL